MTQKVSGWASLPTLALAAAMACGCSGRWSYETPPALSQTATAVNTTDSRRPVLVVGRLANPSSASVPWRDIGQSMADALSRSLLSDGKFDVLIIPELAGRVDPIISNPSRAAQATEIAKVRQAYPNVDYVVTGKVTDFHHTADLGASLERKGFFGRREEAVVAVKYNIIDLAARRVIAVDHVLGTAGTHGAASKELYKAIDFDSYLFWSTPLGEATRQVIDKSRAQLAKLVPHAGGDLRVVSFSEQRTVQINGGRNQGVFAGQEFMLCTSGGPNAPPQPVLDPDTHQSLKLRIDRVGAGEATGWLLGKKPDDLDPVRTVLTRADDAAAVPVAAADQ